MANNDPTAAINIIFDSPRLFKKPEYLKKTGLSNGNLNPKPPTVESNLEFNAKRVGNSNSASNSNGNLNARSGKIEGADNDNGNSTLGKEMGSEWWLVGTAEVAGLSTCKGRSLNPGDEVNFTFPVERKSTTPSPGKFGGGRGRPAAACSEIVRFSTKAHGEVMYEVIY